MSLISTAIKAAVAAPVGWIAFSRFGIDHDAPLRDAVSAERRSVRTAAAGYLSYYADERGEGRPLVLIHSVNAAANPQELQPLFSHFAGSRPVYALDLPGYGFSDRKNRVYTPRLFADAIGEFLLALFNDPVDVVALSLACEFVALVDEANPDSISSIVYISPTGLRPAADPTIQGPEVSIRSDGPSFRLVGKGAAVTMRRRAVNVGVRTPYIHRFLSFPLWSQAIFDLVVTRPSIRYFFPRNEPADDVIEYCYQTSHRPGARHVPLYFLSGELYSPNIADVYSKSSTPTLVLYGKDRFTTFERLDEVLEANANWHSMRFDDLGSMVHQQNPTVSTAAMEDFWAHHEK